MLLSNFHCAPDYNNPQKGQPGHDPLHKIRPIVNMCKNNCHLKYRPSRFISFDEGSCGFRGRVKWLTYNKDKPQKWGMKIFEVADALNGFVCGFDVYCGKNQVSCANDANVLDPQCTQTTRTVVGLLGSLQLLERGHFVYLDNYYNSYELNLEFLGCYTFVCGMLRKNCKGNSKTVVNAKLKKGFEGLKWCEKKRSVTMMTTIHSAVYVEVNRRNREDDKIKRPLAVYDYTQKMSGVDLNDQFIHYYNSQRRSVKWTSKLAIHLFSLCVTNVYIHYKM